MELLKDLTGKELAVAVTPHFFKIDTCRFAEVTIPPSAGLLRRCGSCNKGGLYSAIEDQLLLFFSFQPTLKSVASRTGLQTRRLRENNYEAVRREVLQVIHIDFPEPTANAANVQALVRC